LSDNGPYVGLLIRPFDGEIPRKIGFVCWADNNEGKGESGIKSLSYAIHEAMLAKNKVDGLEISLFFPDNDDYIKELKRNDGKVPGVITKKGGITAIKEVQESKNLIVRWDENGNVREDEFEMLVLSTMPEPTTYIVELAKKLDINLEGVREGIISLEAFDINKRGGRRNHA
jgi:heterodisulfide reductase subunit A-like polyferredoxin